jgi:hypothetical protein
MGILTMFRTTLAVAAVMLLTLPALADHRHDQPQGGGQLLRYTDQIRAQMALVRAQTDATFEHVRGGRFIAGDIYGQLDDLCRELDQLEELAARPVGSRGDFRRLERAVQRVDQQSRDVENAVRSALADPRRFQGTLNYVPTIQSGYFPSNTVGHRGIRLVIGNSNVGVNIGGGQPTPYFAARPVLVGRHGHGDRNGDALCSMTDSLRLMTRQLVGLVCH